MLDISQLENVRERGGKIIARCPACAEEGGDRRGEHLVIFTDERFACAARGGDRAHRRRIFELASCPNESVGHRRKRKPEHRETADSRFYVRQEMHWRDRAESALEHILENWQWDEADTWEASPLRLEHSSECDWRLLLEHLYPAEAVLWIGDKHDSGKPRHAKNFRAVGHWLRTRNPSGPLICPSTFKVDVCSRCDANVSGRPFLVLDGDSVDPICAKKAFAKEALSAEDKRRNFLACLALINWLRSETNLVLRAIVEAANKSAHAWIDYPDPETLAYLRVVVSSLGLDPATLRESQPVRLPGVRRSDTGRVQRLLFLNPVHQH